MCGANVSGVLRARLLLLTKPYRMNRVSGEADPSSQYLPLVPRSDRRLLVPFRRSLHTGMDGVGKTKTSERMGSG